MKKEECINKFKKAIEGDQINKNPSTVITTLTTDICMNMLANVESKLNQTV